MSGLRTSIYARLAADSTLTNLLATNTSIYHQVVPQDAALPAVVFDRQAGNPTWMLSTTGRMQTDLWIVKAIAEGPSAGPAEQIAARIDVVLNDAPLTPTGSVLLSLRRTSDVDYLEQSGADSFHHCGGQYRVVTQPT